MPTLDRSYVAEGEVKVCEVKTPSEDNAIWLTTTGTYSEIRVTSPTATSAGSNTPTANTNTSTAAEQIANVAGQTKATSEDLDKGTNYFAFGAGTEANPYGIANAEQFANIKNQFASSMAQGHYYYFVQIDNFAIDNGLECVFTGSYNGGDYSISLSKNALGAVTIFGVSKYNADIKKLNLYSTKVAAPTLLSYSTTLISGWGYGNASFEKVNVYNNEEGVSRISQANFGFYTTGAIYQYGSLEPITVKINDCHNYASIMNDQRTAAFVGSFYGADSDGCYAKLEITNCTNDGDIYVVGASDGWACLICANTYNAQVNSSSFKPTDLITLSGITNTGRIIGYKSASLFGSGDSFNAAFSSLDVGDKSLFATPNSSLLNNFDFSININGSSLYVNDPSETKDYNYYLNICLSNIYMKNDSTAAPAASRSITFDLNKTYNSITTNITDVIVQSSSTFDITGAIKLSSGMFSGLETNLYCKENKLYVVMTGGYGIGSFGGTEATAG